MSGAQSPDGLVLIIAVRKALLRVLDEDCSAELRVRSLLHDDHESRVHRGICARTHPSS
jgi:hypothetical protein